MSRKTDKFLNGIKDGAMELWVKFGILPSVAGGQGALESAWGTSSLATKYNNIFGIKGNYNGNSAMMNTWEVYDGKRYDIKDNFRSYPDWSTSILDYGVFLTVNPRYKKSIGLTNYKHQIKEIHKAGYATDPNYASKVISIIESYNLDEWDKEVLTNKPTNTKTYTIKSGDTLSGIADKFNTSVSKLVSLNSITNPDKIYTGDKIKISGSTSKKYHKVVSGDTVSELAVQYGSTSKQIRDWNNLDNKYTIYIGDRIRVK